MTSRPLSASPRHRHRCGQMAPPRLLFAGQPGALEQIRGWCAAHHFNVTALRVSHAFHSAFMDPAFRNFRLSLLA